jgi:hypothetical protein
MPAVPRRAWPSRRWTGSMAGRSRPSAATPGGSRSARTDTEADVFQPWHWVTIPAIGIVHGEIFYLEELAVDCAADRVYEFFFCAPALVITRGPGSPINPQAIK